MPRRTGQSDDRRAWSRYIGELIEVAGAASVDDPLTLAPRWWDPAGPRWADERYGTLPT